MLLADLARREGLFEWVATHATKAAKGSPARLFGLVYLAGIAVTVFLSNDATAVVLTPAVYAAAKAAKAKPLPISSSAPLSQTPQASSCRFQTRRTSFSTAIRCPRFGPGLSSLPCRRLFPSPPLMQACAGFTAATSKAALMAMRLRLRYRMAAVRRLWNWRCGGRADPCLGIRDRTRSANLRGRRGDRDLRPRRKAGGALASAERSVLGCASARGRPVRTRRRAQPYRGYRGAYRPSHLGNGAIGHGDSLDRGARARIRNQPHEQSSSGAYRSVRRDPSPCPRRGQRRASHRRDLGPNLSVTGSLATILWLIALGARRKLHRGRVSENRGDCNAARIGLGSRSADPYELMLHCRGCLQHRRQSNSSSASSSSRTARATLHRPRLVAVHAKRIHFQLYPPAAGGDKLSPRARRSACAAAAAGSAITEPATERGISDPSSR